MAMRSDKCARVAEVHLDTESIIPVTPDIDHERNVAIYDLIDENIFSPTGHQGGPYALYISLVDKRLVFDIREIKTETPINTHILSLTPFRRIVKDYFLICESYYEAIRIATPSQIEAIDMGRRGLHDEGSQILLDRLNNKIDIDFKTARRLFTLVCVLHWKG